MQAEYPKKHPILHWDTLNTEYPTRKFPNTAISSKAIGHEWRSPAEVLQLYIKKSSSNEQRNYDRNYNVTNNLTRSQTREHFAPKLPEANRFNKNTSLKENEYICSLSRNVTERPPQCRVHGTSEMKNAYNTPHIPSRLVTNKDQYRRMSTCNADEFQNPSFHKELPPLDTTHDGFEKYLDPYISTNRLEHRPFTAVQLRKPAAKKDTVTHYTYANVPWTRTPEPNVQDIRIPLSRPKSMYDRTTFKQDVRDVTHNRLAWVPGSFQTESKSKYTAAHILSQSKIPAMENEVRNFYRSQMSGLPIYEDKVFTKSTENSRYGSKKPLCSIFDPYVERNKRLEGKFGM